MSNNTNKSAFIATGLMLFALFFGAGNLIFPASMGQQAGNHIWETMLGFLITGAGLPLLGVIAVGYSNSRDLQQLASRVTPWYGVIFTVALYLAIGPLFATPRTATVSFEIGVLPFLGDDASATVKDTALRVFCLFFFACSLVVYFSWKIGGQNWQNFNAHFVVKHRDFGVDCSHQTHGRTSCANRCLPNWRICQRLN